MTPGLVALLLGLFVVPAALLWTAHRLRRRPTWWQMAFRGALIGHVLAAAVALAMMFPARTWADDDRLRGALGFWALLIVPLVGGAIGALLGRRARLSGDA